MFFIIFASLIWAFSYGLIKSELSSLDPNFITVCRMFVACISFLPFLMIKKYKNLIPHFICIGAIQYGAMYLFVMNAYHYLAAYQVVLFSAMTPFYVILINSFTEKQFRLEYFLVAGISIIGFSLIFSIQAMSTDALLGFFLVQCSDACFAFGQIAYRKLKKNNYGIEDKEIFGIIFFGGLLMAIFFAGYNSNSICCFNITMKQFGILIYLGAVASGLCFYWWNKGISKLHPVMISVFNNLKLLLATLVSIIFFHEHINSKINLGFSVLLMIVALVLAQHYQSNDDALAKHNKN